MTLFRILLVAGAAGIAGLALGVILGRGAAWSTASAQSAPVAETAEMSVPAYMIVMGTVHDRAAFGSGYVAHLPPLYARHGGEYVALTGSVETLEGETDFQSVVMSRWPNAQAARDFWNDPEYRALANARIDNHWGDFHVILVEGLPVPVPQSDAADQGDDD